MNVSEQDTAMQEYCDIIMHEADRMNNLVLSMLEQSQYSSGSKMPEL